MGPLLTGVVFLLEIPFYLRNRVPTQKKLLVLQGMLNARGHIPLKNAAKLLGMSPNKLEARLYQLVGEGTITGEMRDNSFYPTDTDQFLTALDSAFDLWEYQAAKQIGKI